MYKDIIKLVSGDITKIPEVEAIVNAANSSLEMGGGVCGAIFKAAGSELAQECKEIGGCNTGEAVITKGYNLPNKYIIHTVGPRYSTGENGESEKLESAYYESLKDKRDRYIYLVKRSNLKCSMLEIPDDAIARVDEKGRLTKPEYKDIYDTVERNVDTLKSRLFSGEWRVCAGILGDKRAFASATVLNNSGFKSRARQSVFLAAQLGEVDALKVLARYFSTSAYMSGSNKNLSRSLEFQALYENPPLDEYGMIPYLDEIIGSDFIMDFNRRGVIINPTGSMHRHLIELIEEGRLLDPRDIDANEKTREEFINYVKKELPEYAEIFYEKAFPSEFANKDISLYIDSTLLESKIMSLTPPEGYPNAPYYNTPEELKRMYESGKLDKRLNPLTPTMYKPSFPKDLKDKIEEYAKEHNIKD